MFPVFTLTTLRDPASWMDVVLFTLFTIDCILSATIVTGPPSQKAPSFPPAWRFIIAFSYCHVCHVAHNILIILFIRHLLSYAPPRYLNVQLTRGASTFGLIRRASRGPFIAYHRHPNFVTTMYYSLVAVLILSTLSGLSDAFFLIPRPGSISALATNPMQQRLLEPQILGRQHLRLSKGGLMLMAEEVGEASEVAQSPQTFGPTVQPAEDKKMEEEMRKMSQKPDNKWASGAFKRGVALQVGSWPS